MPAGNVKPHKHWSVSFQAARLPQSVYADNMTEGITESEFELLVGAYPEGSSFDVDALYGYLHAAAVCPTRPEPDRLRQQLITIASEPDGKLSEILERLYEDIEAALGESETLSPADEDVDLWWSFARGYVRCAGEDQGWKSDAERWSFAEPFEALAALEDPPASYPITGLGPMIIATYQSFQAIRDPNFALPDEA